MDEVQSLIDARRTYFRSVGDEYDRARPQYPTEAVAWMVEGTNGLAIDVGCGPGKLTFQIEELGRPVIGVDPSTEMLKSMRAKGLAAVCGTAEALPLRDGCAAAVTAAQAFHWFDHERAVPEFRRVLQPNGRVGLAWNLRNEDVEWVASLSQIIGSEDAMSHTLGPSDDFESDVIVKLEFEDAFDSIEMRTFTHEQELTEESLVNLVSSRSYVAMLSDDAREEVLSNVRRLCRDHPELRGKHTFGLPYITTVFRTRVLS